MDLTEIPFVKAFGIERVANGSLGLPFNEQLLNHVQTISAGAQFSLAETASGEMLQITFPNLVGKIIPVLRDSQIKFRKPAVRAIIAYPTVSNEGISKFNEQILKKGRALISVSVEIRDSEGVITAEAMFNWFVQSIATEKT